GADSLAQGIAQAAQDLAHATNVAGTAPGAQPLARSQEAAGRAHRAMGQAAGAAAAGDPRAAGAAGAEAETALAEIPKALRARRDSLVQAWREEKIGRASCRERVESWVVAGARKVIGEEDS